MISSEKDSKQELLNLHAKLHANNTEKKIWKAIHLHHELTSPILGAETRTARHLLLIGAMTFDVELQQRINLQVAIYFSIVLRNACWASFVSLSTSVNSTTLKSR
uniref:Uncharacterized protein n=1 Tax=Micrurus surinamensis TaxID=129470 RepID=A0A2D4P1B5_MICSU